MRRHTFNLLQFHTYASSVSSAATSRLHSKFPCFFLEHFFQQTAWWHWYAGLDYYIWWCDFLTTFTKFCHSGRIDVSILQDRSQRQLCQLYEVFWVNVHLCCTCSKVSQFSAELRLQDDLKQRWDFSSVDLLQLSVAAGFVTQICSEWWGCNWGWYMSCLPH